MATISTPTVLDEVTARTAGEAWTINTGGSLTIQTDTRWHAKAPGSGTGSLGNITVNEGDVLIDATRVRWLAITGGSGTAAIGTTVTQGGVSGYFLGYWASLTAYPSTTIGATGFIKFREVTGGAFAAGALTGITATADGPDVPGWIEIVHDQNTTLSVPRLGSYTTRGDWFELGTTTGVVDQVVQTPTMNGGATTYVPAVWIETGVGTGEYEIYPSLYTWTNGWAKGNLGTIASEQDSRQKFVSSIGSGQVQIGQADTQTGTYTNIAAQASTYSSVAHSGSYTWANDVVTVYMSGGHFLRTGEQTGLDFTSGAATDGIYTVTILDAYYFTVALAGSGTGGNVTSLGFIAITLASHVNNIGFQVYCDFTSGTGVDGIYEVVNVGSTSVYWVRHPHVVNLTAGNVSVKKGITGTTATAHGMNVGSRVELAFDADPGYDGYYTVETVPTTTTFTVNIPAVVTGGNVTITRQIGYVPVAGCRIRIPNIIGRQCVTTTRAVNAAPHATIATRPEFATTSAGYIDIENLICDWYFNFAQPYNVRVKNTATLDQISITECATAFNLDNVGIGMHGALDAVTLNLISNFAGGYVGYVRAERGNAPGANDHAVSLSYCNDVVINGLVCGIIQFARNTGRPIYFNICNNTTVDDIKVLNANVVVTTSNGLIVNKIDICDRYTGYSNATATYSLELTSSNDVTIANLSFGDNFTIPNCHSVAGLLTSTGCNRVKLRNCGTFAAPIPNSTWGVNAFGLQRVFNTGGNNNTIKLQEIYLESVQSAILVTANSDKNVLIENVHCNIPQQVGTRAIISTAIAFLNATVKNLACVQSLSGQASVYGTHWANFFNKLGYGQLVFCMNEPTTETAPYVTTVSGTAKFNSSGGVILPTVGNQVIWETSDWVRGTTFLNAAPLMTGGTIGNYTLTYALNTGSGYGAFKSLTGANLSAEVIPATGFKMKLSIQTAIANTTAITFLRIFTLNDGAVNAANPYPLDTFTLTLSGLVAGSDVTVLAAGTETILSNTEDFGGTSFQHVYETPQTVDLVFNKPGYFPTAVRGYVLGSSDASLPITQSPDPSYLE